MGMASMAVVAVTLGGCHKNSHQASRQRTAPDVTAGSNSADARRNVRPVHLGTGVDAPPASAGVAKPLPVPSDVHGKPVSSEIGLASWYGPPYAGRKGADGSVYDQNAMTAAHLTLPLGTMVRVTNLANEQSVVVRITDRGPFVHGRIIDLSLAAARATGVYRAGVAKVRVEAFAAPPLKPNVPSGGRWCVQIGAFLTQEDAISLKNDLLRRYASAKVIEFAGPTGHWVRINPQMPDKAHAAVIAESIHIPDAEPYLIRTD
jgi:rare lipoprotein A